MTTGVNSETLFWQCPVSGHDAVTWAGAEAYCGRLGCGMTSEITARLISQGRLDGQQKIVLWLRQLAEKARIAQAKAPNGTVIHARTALPASIIERAADLVAQCPMGDRED